MAVSFVTQPVALSIQASDTPITFVFSSTQTGQPNFCYIVETWINGVPRATDQIFPERGNRAHIDVSKTTSVWMRAAERSTGLTTIEQLYTVQVKVYEKYGTVPAIQPSPGLSNIVYCTKATCANEDFKLNWVTDKYTPSFKWLTDAPDSTLYLSRNYPINASILNTDEDVRIEVYAYKETGPSVAILAGADFPGAETCKVNVQVTSAMIIPELEPGVDWEDVHRLEIYLNQSQALNVIFIDEDCGDFNQISWLNNVGGYDQFLFTHNKEQEAAISMREYKKQFGAWNGSNNFVYNDLNTGDTVYLKTIEPSGTLYSGWLSESYKHWLNQIYFSVDQIIYSGESTVEKIVVTNTKATYDKERFEDLLNFQVNYKKNNFKSITQ